VKARINLNFFDYESLEKELATLPLFYQIAFAAACCERMLPNYNYFFRLENFGNPEIPRAALDEIWQHLIEEKTIEPDRVEQLIEDCGNEDIFPDSLDYGATCNEALETLQALIYTIDSFREPSIDQIIKVAQHARNIIEAYVPDSGEPYNVTWEKDGEEKYCRTIASHPFAVRELAKESEDLQRLKQAQTLDRDLLEWLRTSFNNDGKSLIDLS
jgi:uncharacterized protein